MNTYLFLLTESLVSIATSLIVVIVLARPLRNVLSHICPDENATTFWLSYTKVMLLLAPLLLVLLIDLISPFQNPLDNLRLTLMAAIGGVLVGLRAIDKRLEKFVAVPAKAEGVQ